MLSNVFRRSELLVGFGSLIVLLTCLGCVSETKKRTITNQINVLASVATINDLFNEARIAAAHAETGDPVYSEEVARLTQMATEKCDRLLEIMFAPANRERVNVIKEYMWEFAKLDDVLKALNQDFRDRRAERVVAANGFYEALDRAMEAVQGAAVAGAVRGHLENGVFSVAADGEVMYTNLDRLNAMARITAIQRHFGLARVAVMNFEVALTQAERDRYWHILESEIRAIVIEVNELENYIISPAGRQALVDLQRYAMEWQTASNGVGDTIRRKAANSAAIERLSTQVDELLAHLIMAVFERTTTLIDEL